MDAPSPSRTFRTRGALLGVIVVAMLFTSVYPLGRWYAMRQDISELEAKEAELVAAIAAIEAERGLLMTDAEVERLARERLGFVAPGEAPFVIITPQPEEAGGADAAGERGGGSTDTLLGRWWRAMSRTLRVS